MRIPAALFLVALFAAGPAPAATDRDAPTPPATPEAVPKSKAAELDELFQTLKTSKDPVAAATAESSIARLWMESGSDTIDLLMAWSIEAIADKNYALALDYLDRITLLKPDYAEGWNKRATVYFLLEDYGKALPDIRRTLALEPRHFGALSGLGLILNSLGEKRRAIEAYGQALALDPRLDKVREALQDLEKETERHI